MLENAHIKYIGFGSPLMDIIADVDFDFMEKYKKPKLDIMFN
jgi:hypothetical protein